MGRSTNYLVNQAQRDLLTARINEAQPIVNHLKSPTNFYRLEGPLLERHGIIAPGMKPPAVIDVAPVSQIQPQGKPTP